MVTLLFLVCAAALLLVTTAGELRTIQLRHRLAHGAIGVVALLLACGTAGFSTVVLATETLAAAAIESADSAPADSIRPVPADAADVEVSESVGPTAGGRAAEPPNAYPPSASASDSSSEPTIYTGPVYPADRPSWVNDPPVRHGEVHSIVVWSGPFVSRQECLTALDAELKQATDAFIDDYLQVDGAARHLRVPIREIHERLVDPDRIYSGTVQHSFGPMQEEHRVIRFDAGFRDQLDQRWREVVAKNRMMQTGFAAGGFLLLLGVVFGYFQADTATRGYYSGRLQFGAALVILTLVVTGVLVAGWMPRL